MGKKKTKLPFLSKNNSVQAKPSWPPWPSCSNQPRTLSFRTDDSSFFKTTTIIGSAETPDDSWFSNSSQSAASFSTATDESGLVDIPVETVIRGLRSERLFFEPGRETSSILEEAKPPDTTTELPFKESVVLSMESQHPYVDFRKSMEEMIEAQGLKDWEGLEELLSWYLRANGKSNHGYILGAFIDLLLKLAIISSTNCIPSSSNCSHSPSSPLSFYTSCSPSSSEDTSTTTPCVSSLEAAEEEIDNTHCLSSLSEAEKEKEIIKDKDDASSSFS